MCLCLWPILSLCISPKHQFLSASVFVWIFFMRSSEGLRVRHLPNNTLYFAEVKREDAGTYTCHAEINKSIGQKHLDVSVVVNCE